MAMTEAVDIPAEELKNAAALALTNQGVIVESCRVRMLRPSRFRPVLQYYLTCFDKEKNARIHRVVIGKGYYRGDGAKAFDTLRQLWSDGFREDPFLTVPEPLAYLPELRLLLQGRAPGKSLHSYLDSPGEAARSVRVAARWLAKLHGASVGADSVLRPEYEEEKLLTYSNVLAQVCPQFAPRIGRLTERIVPPLMKLTPSQAVPTHGDFQPKNIYICRNRVTVIDFDRFALAHPARDVGHFIGQSMTMSYVRTGSFKEIEPWNAAFLDEYARLAPAGPPRELSLFVIRTFLEVLYYKLFVRPVKDPSFVPAWLDACERWLDGGLPAEGNV